MRLILNIRILSYSDIYKLYSIDHNYSNLLLLIQYILLISYPMKLIFSIFAAKHSLPEPTKGTTSNVSSSFLDAFINFLQSSNGFCVG